MIRSLLLGLLLLAPALMKSLAVAGTLAMFVVGGSIVHAAVPEVKTAV